MSEREREKDRETEQKRDTAREVKFALRRAGVRQLRVSERLAASEG